MNAKKVCVMAGTALGVILLITTILLWNKNRELRREQETLHASIDQPSAQIVEPARPQITAEELARLKAIESEVLRLRNQVGLLRRELAQSSVGQGQKGAQGAVESFTPATTNEVGEAFETKLSASIPEGQTLAFGGWTIGTDKRAVAFVYPAVHSGDGTNAQVVIRTTLMEVPAEVWGQLGLADIKTDPQLASQSGLLSQQQAESLIASLANQTNCVILNRPVIQTSDGTQASLFVGEATGSNQQKGLSLDCLPQLSPDGRTVNLTLGMKHH